MLVKIRVIAEFIESSKSYMGYGFSTRAKIVFWLGFPAAFIRFLWLSRNDPYWKTGKP